MPSTKSIGARWGTALRVGILLAIPVCAQYHLSVFLVDSNTGYIGGGTGVNGPSAGTDMLKSENGGLTWSFQTIDAQHSVNGLYFINADTGWAVGWDPVYKTTNGGATWTAVSPAGSDFNYAVFFGNADTGFIAGNNAMLKSTDGGADWGAPSQVNCCDSGYVVYGLQFTDADTGYAVGTRYIAIDLGHFQAPAGLILKTTDGGTNWNSLAVGVTPTLNSVSFGNWDTGWVAGDSGLILYTTDGGTDWVPQVTGTAADLHAICFQGTSAGWAAGDSGVILKTLDGGLHWVLQPGLTTHTLRAMSLLDARTGLIVGDSDTILRIAGGTVPVLQPSGPASASFSITHEIFHYSLAKPAHVTAALFGLDGRLQRRLLDAFRESGDYALDFSGFGVPAGIYLLNIKDENARQSRVIALP